MPQKPTSEQTARLLGEALLRRSETLCTAESCTGGMIGAAITSVAGSSQWFPGGIIAYDNGVKNKLLGVDQSILETFGAVSPETVSAMATAAAKLFATTAAIAVSGIAGPGGGSEQKPVGLVYIGLYYRGQCTICKRLFSGDREAVRQQSVETALSALVGIIDGNG